MRFVRSRFIPAGAGNTEAYAKKFGWESVYPRWRGEHNCNVVQQHRGVGLSPLARGTLAFNTGLRSSERFIPAGAGNTWPLCPDSSLISVYPRWRGEHFPPTNHITEVNGLSPLARGTQTLLNRCNGAWRFIPAGAGNTWVQLGVSNANAVYPRWRGEHIRRVNYMAMKRGLSPLARGTPFA